MSDDLLRARAAVLVDVWRVHAQAVRALVWDDEAMAHVDGRRVVAAREAGAAIEQAAEALAAVVDGAG